MTINDLMKEGVNQLKTVPSKKLEATVLLSYVLKKNKVELYRNMLNQIDSSLALEYKKLLQRRKSGEPLCYITGKRDFFGLEFAVNQFTLIPRHETELLVEESISFFSNHKAETADVLEIGVGSGAISIALSYHCPHLLIDAVDVSNKALCVATLNIEKYALQKKIRLLEGDLFCPIEKGKKYDLIISNPPYIPTHDIPALSKEVLAEPRIALDGGKDGISILRKIIAGSMEYLKPGGFLLLEINGELQEKKITQLFYEYGYRKVYQKKDLASIPRVIGGCKL